MAIWELFVIAVGLSMDAFAVSVCKGLSVPRVRWRHSLIVGVYFGGFQALMPLIGYLLGAQFERFITDVDHWIAFALLLLIGAAMILESRKPGEAQNNAFGVSTMLPLAVATSIDALAVGVTFAFLQVNIVYAVLFIGSITFILSAFGIRVGSLFGSKCRSLAEFIGGGILILMGAKILLEHLGILGF